MAREKVQNFDAENFIESFRESSVPTYHTANEEAPTEPVKPTAKKKEAGTPARKRRIDKSPDALDKKAVEFGMTKEETEYCKTFLGNLDFGQVNRNGKPVVVREDYRQIIIDIFTMMGLQPNMAAYVDAVLSEHLKQFYPLIQSISEKCPPKF